MWIVNTADYVNKWEEGTRTYISVYAQGNTGGTH